jgi:ketosteroid isomerase-like protein
MSEENVQIYRRLLDMWNRGDFEAQLAYVAPDFEFHTAQLFTDTRATYRRQEGWLEFWNTFRAAWDTIDVAVDRIEDLDDQVLVLFTFFGKGRGSGVEVNIKYAHLAELRNGLVTRVRGFADWAEALEAAGLPE